MVVVVVEPSFWAEGGGAADDMIDVRNVVALGVLAAGATAVYGE